MNFNVCCNDAFKTEHITNKAMKPLFLISHVETDDCVPVFPEITFIYLHTSIGYDTICN